MMTMMKMIVNKQINKQLSIGSLIAARSLELASAQRHDMLRWAEFLSCFQSLAILYGIRFAAVARH